MPFDWAGFLAAHSGFEAFGHYSVNRVGEGELEIPVFEDACLGLLQIIGERNLQVEQAAKIPEKFVSGRNPFLIEE